MKFLLDENFPKSATRLLLDLGHEVIDFRQAGKPGDDDSAVFQMAVDESAVILTTDRDFFHTLPALYDGHPGVVVVALRQPNRAAILGRLRWLLEALPLDKLRGRAIQLRDSTWLVLPPMSES